MAQKSSNNLMILNGSGKHNSLQNNKIFLKKHIVIQNKNKNFINDTRKNNNSINDNNYMSNNGKGINLIININLQIKNKNNTREFNQISNYQNMFNGVKFKSKILVHKEILSSNNDL